MTVDRRVAETTVNVIRRHRGTALRTYHDNPTAFVHDCIAWPDGQSPTVYQDEILDALMKHQRVSARGPHGLGKTSLNAWITIWYALTRDGEDWKVITTASAWRHLTKYLWPEIHKWAKKLRWDRIGRDPFNPRTELLNLSLKLSTGEAFAVASDNPALIEGAHADHVLYVFDESKSIVPATFDAAEGAFAGAGPETSIEALAIAQSTPGEPVGRFYEIQSRKPGLDDWWTRHVTLEEAISAGRVSRSWADQRRVQWGANSAVYANRVLGDFASSDEDGVIPLGWVEAANERWRDWTDEGRPGMLHRVGVDVARSGDDKTVLALLFRHGELLAVDELRRSSKEDTMETSGRVAGVLTGRGGVAIVDVIGIGAGVVDRLREQRLKVRPFNASEGTDRKDSTGELGFTNKRGAAWWNMRELLDPTSGTLVALPPDDLLTGDLTAPHWRVMSGGRIQVESKDDIRKRLGRSTDDGDAVTMAAWEDSLPSSGHSNARDLVGATMGRGRRW